MRTHQRFVGITTAILVVAGSAVAAAPSLASASPKAAPSAAASVSVSRLKQSADVRRMAAGGSRTVTLGAITKAVRASEYTEGVPASSYSVRALRTSGSWARVTLQPKKAAELDPATVVLKKSRGAWKVMDLGTAGVGCEVAPSATLKALRLDCES